MKERGRRPLRAAAESVRAVAEVNDLTWSGQPEPAIALATALLERGGFSPGQEAELLDLRAENLHWSGETERSANDVRALGALARRERKHGPHWPRPSAAATISSAPIACPRWPGRCP